MSTIAYQRTVILNALWRWFLLLMAVAMFTTPTVRADIYFWTDPQGVIHFSNQNAPPKAALYMKEPQRVAAPTAPDPESQPITAAEERIQARLEQTSRQLEQALEKVDELTEKVRDSQQEAAVAAAVAQQAAQFSAISAAQSNAEPVYEVRDRVVYYAAPYYHLPRHHKGLHHAGHKYKHHKFNRHKFKHHKFKSHHGKFGHKGHIVHNKFRHKRHTNFHYKGLSTHRGHRIPKMYGIR